MFVYICKIKQNASYTETNITKTTKIKTKPQYILQK